MILGAQIYSLQRYGPGYDSVHGAPTIPISERIKVVKKLGFIAVEVSGLNVNLKDDAAKINESGIKVAAIANYSFNPCHPDKAVLEKEFKNTAERIKIASEMRDRPPLFIGTGSRNPMGGWVAHKDNLTEWAFKMSTMNLKRICRVAEEYDITLALEVGVSTVGYSGKRLRRLLNAVGSEKLKIHMDLANFMTFPFRYFDHTEYINELFDELQGTIVDAHLKDFTVKYGHNISSVMDHAAPGKGELDWDTYLLRIDGEMGDRGYAIFEYVGLDELPEARAFIEAKAKNLGISVR